MTIITTGVPTPAPLSPRLEIRTLFQDREMMDLYLLGLNRFQNADSKDPLSYYQVAGIHGRPYVAWDGVASNGKNNGREGGYCIHGTNLFPTWHRPYLALYEQALTKHVKDIANEYTGPEKAKYVAAAAKFRIPYWDWAANGDLPDYVSIEKEVTVHGPKGPKKFPNPLFSYAFKGDLSTWADGIRDSQGRVTKAEEEKWEARSATLRMPRGVKGQEISDTTRLERELQGARADPRIRTFNLLNARSYETIAGTNTQNGLLESLHNVMHVMVGGDGHMSVPDYAAFDPVFWLHHCNVDRIYALWQALHPEIRKENAMNPTDANVPLKPFRHPQGQFWTSAQSWDTRAFNYTYPELAQWGQLTPEAKATSLRDHVITVYGRNAPFAAIRPELFADRQAQPKPASAQPAAAKPASKPAQPAAAAQAAVAAIKAPLVAAQQSVQAVVSAPAASSSQQPKSYLEWVASVTASKYASKSSFSVFIFLGNFNSDPSEWSVDPNLVGRHAVFANNVETTGCERCQTSAAEGGVVTGTVPLTAALAQRLGQNKIDNLTPEEVTPYLQKELHWRIQLVNGTVIERADMPSLQVSVSHFPVTVSDSATGLSVWGDGVVEASITAGRPGGASS
ncbi:Di-copper centre-containing protein [Serendipita vermifera]|nr:Di-copper centre-containing protein [Serendipita vermifera]